MESHVLQILSMFPANKGTPLTFSVAPLLQQVQQSLIGQDGRWGKDLCPYAEESPIPLRACHCEAHV